MFFLILDIKSPIPLHEQLKVILKEEILNGFYTDKIPSERELMERFSVSRSTVRQAVLALVNEGVLEKIHGRGTFISFRPVEEWLGNLTSFNDIVKEMGMKPGIKLVKHGITNTPEDAATTLGLNEFYLIERMRYADDIPIAIEKQYYPIKIGETLAEHDLNDAALYDILEKSLGINLWKAQEIITCTMPSPDEAAALNLADPICVLTTERFISDSNDNPIEYEKNVFRADMYAFRINLTRRLG
ncbi:MAG: GntR family transcriptional regulator [Peptococcaceae bacterium]